MNESKSTLGTRLVGFVLATSAWNDGISWLPQEEIAEQANVSEREVRYAIEKLVELGELEKRKVQRGRRRVNVYRVRLGARVPQYERLPFDVDDPFADDDRQDLPLVDDRQNPSKSDVRRPAKSVVTTGKIRPNPAPTLSIGPSKRIVSATAPTTRPRDLIWDELIERFGAVAEKTNAHAKRNKAVTDLKRLGATPDAIAAAVAAWPRVFPGATLTDIALATHWPQLVTKITAVRPTRPIDEVLDLPEPDAAANLEHIREMAGSIGREVA
jgi:DNA-binding Lrp family transcriptional regulator